MIDDAMREAGEAVARARESVGDATGSPAALLAQARDVVAAVEAATEEPAALKRVRRGAFHLAGLLDALGLLPFDAAAAVAAGIGDYAADHAAPDEPPAES